MAQRITRSLGVALLLATALAGCGGEARGGSAARVDVHAALPAVDYPLFWAGQSTDGLPLTDVVHRERWTTFVYGTCHVTGTDGGCSPPLEIQVDSVCDRNPLKLALRPHASFVTRGVPVRDYGDGRLELTTGTSNVTVFAKPARARRALSSLRPVRGAGRQSALLPAARYPREYIAELRRVRETAGPTENLDRVRRALRISRSAARFRLALATELGAARLMRGRFVGVPRRDCQVEAP